LDDFQVLTRIHYKAESDEHWGEHEIDHILFIQLSHPVTLNLNKNEVSDIEYVGIEQLKKFIDSKQRNGCSFTPWFLSIRSQFLMNWWNALISRTLFSFVDEQIHRMT